MMFTKRQFTEWQRAQVARQARLSHVLIFILVVGIGDIAAGQAGVVQSQNSPSAQTPAPTQVLRLRVLTGESREVYLPGHLSSLVIVSPEFASAVLTRRGVKLSGLKTGETILFAFEGTQRYTYVVEVVGRTLASARVKVPVAERLAVEGGGLSGVYSLAYSAPFDGAPTALRQRLEFHRKLTSGGTFRFNSDALKTLGQRGQARTTALGLELNRVALGIDGPARTLDFLDSELRISPISFNGFAMRGFHLKSTSELSLGGLEIFAGLARPSLDLLDKDGGAVLGVVAPLASGESWRVRGGFFEIIPQRGNRLANGGQVFQMDASYAPNKHLAAAAEVAYSNGGLSWGGRFDLQGRSLIASGEIQRVDRRSALISIAAQSGGQQTESFAVRWQANERLKTSASYSHTAIVPPATSSRATLDRTNLSLGLNLRLNRRSRLAFTFIDQQIQTGDSRSGSRFRLETRTLSLNHELRFDRNWSNNFNVRLSSSREPLANAGTENGVVLNEQLRRSFKGGAVVGFVNYTRQTQSLAGLIMRNPQLLPPLLQTEFTTDPARFLEQYRDSLELLLPGVELPRTNGLDAGLRVQANFSRLNFNSELRFSDGEFFGKSQRRIRATGSVNFRLDAANSVQVSGSRAFNADAGGQPQLTVSYAHRFGAGSGGGFQFSRLLGLDHARIEGRVFFDLNANGQADTNEPGVAGVTIQLGDDRSVTTDEVGHFQFRVNSGAYNIMAISRELGVGWRATTATERHGFVSARQTAEVSFGLTNYGAIGGRVFNDISENGEQNAGSFPGVAGVSLKLTPSKDGASVGSVVADAGGFYQFRNVAPGSYTVTLDPATLPPDFRVPAQTTWAIEVRPLQNSYLDIPVVAQRAVSGVVFIDKDGNGKFDREKDEPIAGARVFGGKMEAVTGKEGTYILRNVPAGRIDVRACAPWGVESEVVKIDIGDGPISKKGVDFIVRDCDKCAGSLRSSPAVLAKSPGN